MSSAAPQRPLRPQDGSAPSDEALIDRVRERLAAESAEPTAAVIAEAIRAESGGVLGDTDLLAALRHLQTELTGAGRLEVLLSEPGVADVLVVGPTRVWVDRGSGLEPTDVTFDDDAAVRRLAARLALGAGTVSYTHLTLPTICSV